MTTTRADTLETDRSPVSDHERAMLGYIVECGALLGLRDWEIVAKKVAPGTMPEDMIAHAEIAYGRKVLTVSLAQIFWTESPEDQRVDVAHELVHAHLDEPGAVVRDIETQLGTLQYEMLNETYKRANENAVDAIAVLLAPLLPMPPAPAP